MRASAGPAQPPDDGAPLFERLFSRRALVLLTRNTIVSTFAFGVGLLVLWVLVEQWDTNKLVAGALSFVTANSLHYWFGRTWIFKGSERRVATGYAFFLINGLIGLVLTVAIFAVLLAFGMQYIIARIVTSVIAGLVMFLSNAFLNFRVL